MKGRTNWIYFGGGTPNTLTTDDLGEILRTIRKKVQTNTVGIELLPALLTGEYLEGLKGAGFTKVSVGVESFSPSVLGRTGRRVGKPEHTKDIIDLAKSLGLSVNADMMVGLPNQNADIFLHDIGCIAAMHLTKLPSIHS